MLKVLQCTAKQMAHFILETDPVLSTGILVSKEVLKWNHLSKSCTEIVKLIYHIYGWFAYKKKEWKLKEECFLLYLQHSSCSIWGFPEDTHSQISYKQICEVWWAQSLRQCGHRLTICVHQPCSLHEILIFQILLHKWFCSPSRQLSRPGLIFQDTAVMEGGQHCVVSV